MRTRISPNTDSFYAVVSSYIKEMHSRSCQIFKMKLFEKIITHLAFTCSKLAIETQKQGVKYVQS